MALISLLRIWWSVFFLPVVLGSGGDTAPGLATILILLFILLLLVILLGFSWHRLNIDTDDKYHPRQLCRGGNGEAEGRGAALALLSGAVAGRWRALQTRLLGASSVQLDHLEEVTTQEQTGPQDSGDAESAGDNDDCHNASGESEDDETDKEDDYSSMECFQPGTIKEIQQADAPSNKRLADKLEPKASEALLPNMPTENEAATDSNTGSSAALLASPQPYSGSETWAGDGPEGSVSVRVTAL